MSRKGIAARGPGPARQSDASAQHGHATQRQRSVGLGAARQRHSEAERRSGRAKQGDGMAEQSDGLAWRGEAKAKPRTDWRWHGQAERGQRIERPCSGKSRPSTAMPRRSGALLRAEWQRRGSPMRRHGMAMLWRSNEPRHDRRGSLHSHLRGRGEQIRRLTPESLGQLA